MIVKQQKKTPVESFFYSREEWDRLGCGPLPAERDRAAQRQNVIAQGNPVTDGKHIKGYN